MAITATRGLLVSIAWCLPSPWMSADAAVSSWGWLEVQGTGPPQMPVLSSEPALQ